MKAQCVALCVVASLLSGCEGMDKEKIGAIGGGLLGAAGGAYAGSKMTKDPKTGMLIGGAVGLVGGVLIGKELGKWLDERDRKRHAEATAKALETGQSQAWTSPDTGASGQVIVKQPTGTVSTVAASGPVPPTSPSAVVAPAGPAPSPATAPATAPAPSVVSQSAQGRLCRTITQTIVLKDGTTKAEELTACKGPNGWEAA